MNLFWAAFLRNAAQHSNTGSIRHLDGVEAAWVCSELIINNATYLASPAASESELNARLATASQDARAHALPWVFYLYEPFVAGMPAEAIADAFAEFGLARALGVQVMTGDAGALKPPARPLPQPKFQRITSREQSWAALDLNLRSYGMPVSMADSVLDTNAYFSDRQREFGFLAVANGVPVSTATVMELDGWLYVALVATDPDHRQKGYAEAVMRHALDVAAAELRLSRTALDASLMGAPLYLQMGYEYTGEAWTMYVPS